MFQQLILVLVLAWSSGVSAFVSTFATPTRLVGHSAISGAAEDISHLHTDFLAIQNVEVTASVDGLPRLMGQLILEKDVTAVVIARSFG